MPGPESLFKQTITYGFLTGRAADGKPVLSGLDEAPARVQPSRKMIRDAAGADQMTSSKVFTAAAITMRSRVWLPGTDTSNFNHARQPLAIDEHVDGSGVTRFRTVWF